MKIKDFVSKHCTIIGGVFIGVLIWMVAYIWGFYSGGHDMEVRACEVAQQVIDAETAEEKDFLLQVCYGVSK